MKKFFLFFFILILLFYGSLTLAMCTARWNEYRCEDARCGGNILIRPCWEYCNAWETVCHGQGKNLVCFDVCVGCGTACGNHSIHRTGKSWQICQNGLSWSRIEPKFKCIGRCIQAPTNPRYFNNPISGQGQNVGNRDVLLPVRLDWDDVYGWQRNVVPIAETLGKEDGPQSYRITINNTRPTSPLNKVIQESEFIPDQCVLRSNTEHTWQVQACCTANGENCGRASDWEFTTNLAPELKSPLDPDWLGLKRIENIPVPFNFDWCDVENAQSYFLKLDKIRPPIIRVLNEPLSKESNLRLGREILIKTTNYNWRIATCLRENGFMCGINCHPEQNGIECGSFSQIWRIRTENYSIPPPEIESPLIINNVLPVVNVYDYLKWNSMGMEGAISYYYEIKKNGRVIFSSFTPGGITSVSLKDFWEHLNFNQKYTWTIRSCWDNKGKKCEEKTNQSSFITTGAPPTNLTESPSDQYGNKIIPVTLNWDDMPNSASYEYELFLNETRIAYGIVLESNISFSYDKLKMGKNYNWRVRACADKDGKFCAEKWSNQNFRTFVLDAPVNPYPQTGGNFYTHERHLKWNEVLGAKFYQYKISGPKQIPLTIVPINSAFLDIPRFKLGNYAWQVRACLDKNCSYAGEWSTPWSFVLIEPEICKPGLIPCGRDCNVPETPWNEREHCQIKHLFIMLYLILNFLLWTMIPLILIVLVAISGLIFYFALSTGDADPISKVKGLWRAVGIGLLIVFLAWNMISIILWAFGYQVGIFGLWYRIPI